jgi:pyruvate formate lyase activating enzyme
METYVHDVVLDGDSVTVWFSGCDFKCRFCNVPHLVEFNTGEVLDTRQIAAQIDTSGARTVLFTGGEPLLQRQALFELLRHCAKRGLRTIVGTNASKPDVLKGLLDEHLVSEFQVDVKAPARSFGKVTRAATFFKSEEELYQEFESSLALLRNKERRGVAVVVFKTLIVPGLLYKKEDLLELARLLSGFDAEWLLEPFDPARTLDPALRGVSPPTRGFLENLAGFVRKEYPELHVRVGGSE